MVENLTEKIADLVSKTKRNPAVAKRVIKIIGIYALIYAFILVIMTFFEISREDIKTYFDRFGYFSAVLFFFAVVLIAMTPLPDAPLIATGIIILGVPIGFVIIWSSMVTASIINFAISKKFGRRFVVANYPETTRLVDIFTRDNGIETIIIARMFTFVSFDMVSYAAGLTAMSYKHFFIASTISMLPIAINLTFVGAGLAAQSVLTTALALGASALMALGLGLLVRRWRKNHPDLSVATEKVEAVMETPEERAAVVTEETKQDSLPTPTNNVV